MEKLITVGTWLPCFPGFYETFLAPDESQELEYIDDTRRELGLIGRVGDYIPNSSITFKVAEYEEEVAYALSPDGEYDLIDYARGNMNWSDVEAVAVQAPPTWPLAADYQAGWVNGEHEVVES